MVDRHDQKDYKGEGHAKEAGQDGCGTELVHEEHKDADTAPKGGANEDVEDTSLFSGHGGDDHSFALK